MLLREISQNSSERKHLCRNLFFWHHQTTASYCNSINSISHEGRIDKRNCKFMIQKPRINLSHKCHLLRSTLTWNKRFQKQSFVDSIKKRLQCRCFSVKFTKVLRTSFLKNSYSGCFWGLTRVFKEVGDTNRCDCLQYIPDLAEEGICCRENPEAATVGVL